MYFDLLLSIHVAVLVGFILTEIYHAATGTGGY